MLQLVKMIPAATKCKSTPKFSGLKEFTVSLLGDSYKKQIKTGKCKIESPFVQ